MKTLIVLAALFSFSSVADSYIVVAKCSGELEGQSIRLNLLQSDQGFCGGESTKGLIVSITEPMTAAHVDIDFDAKTVKASDGTVRMTFDQVGFPGSTKAKLKLGIGSEAGEAELNCDFIHYSFDC